MNISRKAAVAVSCILLFLALFLGAMIVYNKLDAPEYYPAYELVDGEFVSETVRNPAFLDENQRPIYEFLLDLNPMGQAVQHTDLALAHPTQAVFCSLGTIAATTVAGMALFRRKNLY